MRGARWARGFGPGEGVQGGGGLGSWCLVHLLLGLGFIPDRTVVVSLGWWYEGFVGGNVRMLGLLPHVSICLRVFVDKAG